MGVEACKSIQGNAKCVSTLQKMFLNYPYWLNIPFSALLALIFLTANSLLPLMFEFKTGSIKSNFHSKKSLVKVCLL